MNYFPLVGYRKSLQACSSFIVTFSVSELFVDNPTENDRLDVKLNITLPRMKCERKYTVEKIFTGFSNPMPLLNIVCTCNNIKEHSRKTPCK